MRVISKPLRLGKDAPRTTSSAPNPSVQLGQLQGPGDGTAASLSGASCVCLTGRRQSAGASRHVVVLIWTVFVSFHIVSVYK